MMGPTYSKVYFQMSNKNKNLSNSNPYSILIQIYILYNNLKVLLINFLITINKAKLNNPNPHIIIIGSYVKMEVCHNKKIMTAKTNKKQKNKNNYLFIHTDKDNPFNLPLNKDNPSHILLIFPVSIHSISLHKIIKRKLKTKPKISLKIMAKL